MAAPKKSTSKKVAVKKITKRKPKRTTVQAKKQFIERLEFYLGKVSAACRDTKIGRRTVYDWLDQDQKLVHAVEDIQEGCIDFVESKLYEKIEGVQAIGYDNAGNEYVYKQAPSDTAIIFFLKTRARTRGYIEHKQIEVIDKTPKSFEIVHASNKATG